MRSVTPLTPLLAQWRGLKADLTRKEVRRLLGEPLRVQPPLPADHPGLERWRYVYRSARTGAGGELATPDPRVEGSVLFARDGRLVSWIEPDWEALPA